MIILYQILNLLYSNGAKSKVLALSQKDIEEVLASEGQKMCTRSVYNRIRELSELGYISEGFRIGNAKTYYVNSKGIKWMKESQREEEEENDNVQ
jgi:repressor of nif and glnA expression